MDASFASFSIFSTVRKSYPKKLQTTGEIAGAYGFHQTEIRFPFPVMFYFNSKNYISKHSNVLPIIRS